MYFKIFVNIFILALFLTFSNHIYAQDGKLSISGKEIIEKLARLEEGQKSLNKRIDDVNKGIDKNFNQTMTSP